MITKLIQFTLSMILILATAACSVPSPSETQTLVLETPSAAPTVSPTANNPCANAYFPTVQGATWTYTGSASQTGPFAFTNTITSVRADGFTLSTQFGEATSTQEWVCKPEGLLALQLANAGAAALASSGMDAQFTTSNVQGVTVPANLQPGSQWTYSFDLEGTATLIQDTTTDISGTGTFSSQALNIETVTVPAGTFDALKIQVDSTFSLTATVYGFGVPIIISVTSYIWYAPGIGLIKSMDTAEFGGTSYSATTELQSYAIP